MEQIKQVFFGRWESDFKFCWEGIFEHPAEDLLSGVLYKFQHGLNIESCFGKSIRYLDIRSWEHLWKILCVTNIRLINMTYYVLSCHVRKRKIVFFFYLRFVSSSFTNHRTAGEGGDHFINSSLPLPSASQTLADT